MINPEKRRENLAKIEIEKRLKNCCYNNDGHCYLSINLNSIDLKLALLLRNNEELPDSELTETFLKRYREYLFNICDRCQKLLQKYKV